MPPSFFPYLEAQVLNLEEEHATLRGDVDTLKELYHGLAFSVEKLEKGGWPVTIGPFQAVDPATSHQDAMAFKSELETLGREVHKSVNGGANMQEVNGMGAPKLNDNVPPHLRTASATINGTAPKSLPPHLRGKKPPVGVNGNGTHEHPVHALPNNSLITDGQVDVTFGQKVGAPEPSPPSSPAAIVQLDNTTTLLKDLTLNTTWKPYYVTTLQALPGHVLVKIPGKNMVTFHPDFIRNTFDGVAWSPGLRFVKGTAPCILRNRTYYLLDPITEPYVPNSPGEHGAKLTAFFNKAPEEEHGDLFDADSNSYEDVPMFVEVKDAAGRSRYAYYGNYSQTRWSDKLDNDTMVARVPQAVKEFWATELTAATREDWVTEELKNHFFEKPKYVGRLYSADDQTTVNSEEEAKLNEKMAREVRKYVKELQEWGRDAKMKTAMIKKQFILDAFNAADADDMPALRLWWEYLECVDWKKDFYDLLVALQSRDSKQYFK